MLLKRGNCSRVIVSVYSNALCQSYQRPDKYRVGPRNVGSTFSDLCKVSPFSNFASVESSYEVNGEGLQALY